MGTVPENEKDVRECISFARMNLRRFAESFQLSVSLFEFLERGGGPPSVGVFGGIFIQYRIIAARDGALNLSHFRCSLDALIKLIPNCPSVAKCANLDLIKFARETFDEYFPDTDTIRNAIAHAGEIHNTPIKLKTSVTMKTRKTRGAAFGAGGIPMHSLFERTYSLGRSGKLFSVDVNSVSVSRLTEIILLVDRAFGGGA
jgi:hypothetical protein